MTNTKQQETENRTLLTDLYQLTMNAAYFERGNNDKATFDLFIRKLPKDWGFFVAAGIEEAVDHACAIRFTDSDIEYLASQNLFSQAYLKSLKDFRFTGSIDAVPEGTPVTANTPIMRVTGPRMEAQLLETVLLNTINFQTMIASKAARVVQAAGPAKVVDFGLRRAQEKDAAMKGARATYIAGAVATSNVLAGKEFGIPISGTHAHSFVMSFPSEIEAFRAYVSTFPTNPTLLIDTYDTIQGAKNAAIVGRELKIHGNNLGAVRLDSGDLAELSKEVRQILDLAGLRDTKIVASNDLNEYKIAELRERGAKIDGYGVGTEMITAKPVAAISGVYKLVQDEAGAKIKLSTGKRSLPGVKQVFRQVGYNGRYSHDVLALEGEKVDGVPILAPYVRNGVRCRKTLPLEEIRTRCIRQIAKMPEHAKQLVANPYDVQISPALDTIVREATARVVGVGR